MGHRPAVLSRGYARPRRVDGAVVVSTGSKVLAAYDTSGDEPLMLARQLPGCAVAVCPDRYLAGSVAERRLGSTVHILDDGFQHLQLARELDIVIVRRADLDERVIPLGRLREPLAAIAAADAVVVDARDSLEEAVASLGARGVFTMARQIAPPRPEPAFAFAGIGRPGEFFEDLRARGWKLVGSRPFPDHHRYSRGDLGEVVERARAAGAQLLVTTEKDAVRLEGLAAALPIHVAALTLSIAPADAFAAMLRQAAGEPPR